ncbi:tetratricopeptide repeat protein [Flammeovirga sp. SJP92]|uniref:SEL1-like repeat protein n=1 Tax=Flammeovirga sp. SJP92 TaxID=1775430 RepID=UPI0007869BDD|nr:tetratricopeptide repeat protein [Flammeovirga sp. SJP92]KXX67231.1 hypothetical protein AVL50_27990 [Flammeovirga sp. SJP92]
MIYTNRLYLYTFVIFFSLAFDNSFAQDVESLKKQAKFNNDPEAWYQLGLTYEEGQIEKKNVKKASQYYEKAVLQNHPAAALHLAKIKEAKGETTEVIKLYNIAAKGKNAEAHYILGKYYQKGQIVGKDQDKAIYHLLRSWDQNFKDSDELLKDLDLNTYANKNTDIFYQKYLGDSGNAQSEYALGLAYKNGDEVPKDLNKSFDLLTKAADKNHPEAQYELALFYKNGLVGNKDSRKAVSLLLKSANNNNREAIQMLSKMDIKTFVDPNNLEYIQYKAIADNDAEAQYELYLLYANKKNPTKEDELKKVEFCQRAALQDYQPAMLSLADLYFNGTPPLQKSATSAFKWRRQAAYVGSDSAEYLLGNMYAMGEGVAQSEASAIKWYMKAANHGVYSAKVALKQYDISKYLDKSDLEYATYLANQGNLEAQLMLGKYYFKKEKLSAINWLSKAAGQNSAEAELYLGDIYKDGKCQTAQDLGKAENHYQKAIALGNQDAYLKMAQLYAYQKNNQEVSASASKPEAMNYASQYMTRSVAVDSKDTDTNPEAYLIIADIQIQEKNYVEAIKQYDLYIKSFDEANGNHKEFIDVLNKQANAYASIDEVNSALLQIDIALAKSDDFSQLKGFKEEYSNIKGELFYTQAALLFQKGDKYKACNGFQKAKALGIKIESKYEDLCMN